MDAVGEDQPAAEKGDSPGQRPSAIRGRRFGSSDRRRPDDRQPDDRQEGPEREQAARAPGSSTEHGLKR
jgi:hypothetical protein